MLQYCTLPGLRPFWILHCDFGLPSALEALHPSPLPRSHPRTKHASSQLPPAYSSHAATFGHRSQKHPLVILPRSPLLDSPPNRPRTSSSSAVSISSIASSIASPIVASHSPSCHLTVMPSHHVIAPSCHLMLPRLASPSRPDASVRHLTRPRPSAHSVPCPLYVGRTSVAGRCSCLRARAHHSLTQCPLGRVRCVHKACHRQSRA